MLHLAVHDELKNQVASFQVIPAVAMTSTETNNNLSTRAIEQQFKLMHAASQ